ncbi:hypothetical protein BLNAU_21661 [Blattamonas nauphoetae]|uniref:Uncharacterized protein n=1 Tax=Blattamonas nauphoetae TaxID=2049346 RepID=A0ABQ9WWA3_9EUKA|nr:hypothetical protein BLNAU_21661 [Blattamonas nauphoetae]
MLPTMRNSITPTLLQTSSLLYTVVILVGSPSIPLQTTEWTPQLRWHNQNWNGQPSRSSAGIGFRTGVLVVHHFQHNQTKEEDTAEERERPTFEIGWRGGRNFEYGKEYELIIDPDYLTTVSAAGSIVLRNPKELMGGLGGMGGEQGDGMEERLVRVKDGKKMLVRRPNDPRKADKGDLEGESIDFVPGEQNMEEGERRRDEEIARKQEEEESLKKLKGKKKKEEEERIARWNEERRKQEEAERLRREEEDRRRAEEDEKRLLEEEERKRRGEEERKHKEKADAEAAEAATKKKEEDEDDYDQGINGKIGGAGNRRLGKKKGKGDVTDSSKLSMGKNSKLMKNKKEPEHTSPRNDAFLSETVGGRPDFWARGSSGWDWKEVQREKVRVAEELALVYDRQTDLFLDPRTNQLYSA